MRMTFKSNKHCHQEKSNATKKKKADSCPEKEVEGHRAELQNQGQQWGQQEAV